MMDDYTKKHLGRWLDQKVRPEERQKAKKLISEFYKEQGQEYAGNIPYGDILVRKGFYNKSYTNGRLKAENAIANKMKNVGVRNGWDSPIRKELADLKKAVEINKAAGNMQKLVEVQEKKIKELEQEIKDIDSGKIRML